MFAFSVPRSLPDFTELHRQYPRAIRWALMVALALHLLAFLFSPPPGGSPAPRAREIPVVFFDPQPEVVYEQPIPEPAPPASAGPVPLAEREPAPSPATPQPAPSAATALPRHPGVRPRAPRELLEVEQPPVAVELVRPEYPRLAREAGIEGDVAVRVLVGADGRVREAVVVGGEVTPAMAQAARGAALRCRFQPAMQRGRPVSVYIIVPFGFRLR